MLFAYSPYASDNADILAGYQAGQGTNINYRYDTIGRPTATTVSTGSYDYVTAYDYVPGVGGATTMLIASITNDGDANSYTYDANWNIETITERGLVNRYYYDELNQLIREDNGVLGNTIVYTYDRGGNILAKDLYAYTAGAEPDPNTLVRIEYSYDDPVWRDLLTGYNGSTITYDDIGNPLEDGTLTYTWTQGRRLASLSNGGELDVEYKYNDSGIRTQKTVNDITTDYHLVGGRVTYEKTYDVTDAIKFITPTIASAILSAST